MGIHVFIYKYGLSAGAPALLVGAADGVGVC